MDFKAFPEELFVLGSCDYCYVNSPVDLPKKSRLAVLGHRAIYGVILLIVNRQMKEALNFVCCTNDSPS